jgi:predicted acylesterase/phospholipase RssA
MKQAGFYDNTPLFDYLSTLLDNREVKKRLIVSANDALSGAYIHMRPHEYDTSQRDRIVSTVVGSGSIPFFFPPRNMS